MTTTATRLGYHERKFLHRAADGPLTLKRADQGRMLRQLSDKGMLHEAEEGLFEITDDGLTAIGKS
jgi:hypothetical protein